MFLYFHGKFALQDALISDFFFLILSSILYFNWVLFYFVSWASGCLVFRCFFFLRNSFVFFASELLIFIFFSLPHVNFFSFFIFVQLSLILIRFSIFLFVLLLILSFRSSLLGFVLSPNIFHYVHRFILLVLLSSTSSCLRLSLYFLCISVNIFFLSFVLFFLLFFQRSLSL